MKIAFVGHAGHRRTGSARFFLDILDDLGTVTTLLSSPDAIGLPDDPIVERFLCERFDLWVFFQTEYIAARLVALGLRNAVLVPMHDAVCGLPDAYLQQFVACRFATFSRALHARLQRLSMRTACFEYWPAPGPVVERSFARAHWSAFFWERRPRGVPNRGIVTAQCRALGIGRLHVHAAPDDPADTDRGRDEGNAAACADVAITRSTWFKNAADAHRVSAAALFAFAPRHVEGIGMAMLEAMAAGQVVVAADQPTADQSIGHLSSGILYDAQRPFDLPSLGEERVALISQAARARVVSGHRDWCDDIVRLKSFLLDDGQRWSDSDNGAHIANIIHRSANLRRR